MKFCKKCHTNKQFNEFYKCNGNKDGLQGSCKLCMNEVTAKWYAAHPEKNKEKGKRHYKRSMTTEEGRRKNVEKRRKYRERMATKLKDSKCRRCGFVPEDMCQLTIDHIDRNHSNNVVGNLQTLCGNCHYLKTKVEMNAPEKLIILNLVPSTG